MCVLPPPPSPLTLFLISSNCFVDIHQRQDATNVQADVVVMTSSLPVEGKSVNRNQIYMPSCEGREEARRCEPNPTDKHHKLPCDWSAGVVLCALTDCVRLTKVSLATSVSKRHNPFFGAFFKNKFYTWTQQSEEKKFTRTHTHAPLPSPPPFKQSSVLTLFYHNKSLLAVRRHTEK